jgi:hypothetical protein
VTTAPAASIVRILTFPSSQSEESSGGALSHHEWTLRARREAQNAVHPERQIWREEIDLSVVTRVRGLDEPTFVGTLGGKCVARNPLRVVFSASTASLRTMIFLMSWSTAFGQEYL